MTALICVSLGQKQQPKMGNCLSKELACGMTIITENDRPAALQEHDTAAYPYRPYSKVRMITDFNHSESRDGFRQFRH